MDGLILREMGTLLRRYLGGLRGEVQACGDADAGGNGALYSVSALSLPGKSAPGEPLAPRCLTKLVSGPHDNLSVRVQVVAPCWLYGRSGGVRPVVHLLCGLPSVCLRGKSQT